MHMALTTTRFESLPHFGMTTRPRPASANTARPARRIALVVIAAAVTGALLTQPVLRLLIDHYATRNGPWRTSAETGSATANPYTQAAVALAGLYALTRQEAVYFTAFTDSAGEPLRGECRYQLLGEPPAARWWSITAYGADHYLVPNAAGIYSRNATTLSFAKDGHFMVDLASDARGDNSLPIPARGAFSLTLRLYNPPASVLGALETTTLPTIMRGDCR